MSKLPMRCLILPKFEAGEMTGDTPGEAQHYYEHYLMPSQRFEIAGCPNPLFYRDGVGLILTGMGKVNAALTLTQVLSDARFDFSDCFFLGTGCAGSAMGRTVMGDVIQVTSVFDFDLGHHADARDLSDPDGLTWFEDLYCHDFAVYHLNPALMDRVYALIRAVPLSTTPLTRRAMAAAFDDAPWALRDPMVLRGSGATGDNYWKGIHDHRNAEAMAACYNCPDPYMVSEMEDHSLAHVLSRYGLLDRLILIRGSVNMDVFMQGQTPERLWGRDTRETIISDSSQEAADIFFPEMENIFRVGRVIVDSILAGALTPGL